MGFLFLKLGQQNGSDSVLCHGIRTIHTVITMRTYEDCARIMHVDWTIEGFCQDGLDAGTRTERESS